MNRTLIALASLALALPALAHEHEYEHDDMDEDDYSYQSYDYQTPPPEQGPSMDDFRNDRELSWSGEWIDTPEYGVVWRPTRVDSDWRPYQYGRWEWTTVGWAWVSEEPFGWAVYHYGRWAYADSLGWTWVPGRVWAPAWVAWRWGGGYAGWCPLGPHGLLGVRAGAEVSRPHPPERHPHPGPARVVRADAGAAHRGRAARGAHRRRGGARHGPRPAAHPHRRRSDAAGRVEHLARLLLSAARRRHPAAGHPLGRPPQRRPAAHPLRQLSLAGRH